MSTAMNTCMNLTMVDVALINAGLMSNAQPVTARTSEAVEGRRKRSMRMGVSSLKPYTCAASSGALVPRQRSAITMGAGTLKSMPTQPSEAIDKTIHGDVAEPSVTVDKDTVDKNAKVPKKGARHMFDPRHVFARVRRAASRKWEKLVGSG